MDMIIKTTGETITFPYKKFYELEELQEIVGGYIELVYLPNDEIMVVNEEGLLYNLPYNPKASNYANRPIVGDVLICKRKHLK